MTMLLCARCGAENLGTKFCESCGERAGPDVPDAVVAAAAAPSAAAAAPAGASLDSGASPAAAVATPTSLVAPPAAVVASGGPGFLLGQQIMAVAIVASAVGPTIINTIYGLSGVWGMSGYSTGLQWGMVALVFIGLLIALPGSPASAGGRFAALALGAVYVAGYAVEVLSYVGAFAIFIAWALLRRFRGAGWFGLLILVGFVLLAIPVVIGGVFVIFAGGSWGLLLNVLSFVFTVAMVWVVVGASVALERRSERARAARTPSLGVLSEPPTPRRPIAPGILVITLIVAIVIAIIAVISVSAARSATASYSSGYLDGDETFGGDPGYDDGYSDDFSDDPVTQPVAPVAPAGPTLPSCEASLSDAYQQKLISEGAVLNPSSSVAAPLQPVAGTGDVGLRATLQTLERRECRWLSASGAAGWGVETSIAIVPQEQQASVATQLAGMGYRAMSELGGTRYVIEKTLPDGSGHYGESHILRGGYWFATYWSKYGPSGYTADMVTTVVG